jgi:glycosyltransferase involved in cell wall biosynthesis
MSGPQVAVIVPAFDAADTIVDALASVINQRVSVEVIVVDDGSSDGTASIVRHHLPEVTVLRQPNQGPSAARNAGIAASSAPLVAFLDADDVYCDGHLARTITHLAHHPGVDVAIAHSRLVGFPDAELARYRFVRDGFIALQHHLAAGVYRRHAFDRAGQLDPELRWFEDYDWFLRAREVGLQLAVLDHVAFERRYRPDSLSHGPRPVGATVPSVLARSLARRRHAGSAADLGTLSDRAVPS